MSNGWLNRLKYAVLLTPVWTKYSPDSHGWWARMEPIPNPLFSLEFCNSIYFVATVALIIMGCARRWLNRTEIALAAGMLAIPYFSHSDRVMMLAHARYAMAAMPAFLVLGELLTRTPTPLAVALLAISGYLLGAYASLFVAGYPLI